jgi:molybdopterin-containing oxidoreductase family membrane subunit
MITPQHVDKMAKIILLTGSIVGYAYLMELFVAWYSANPFERAAFWNRAVGGPVTWAYWCMMTCNVISPQLFWFKACRKNILVVFIVCQFVNAGMWYERYVIIVSSLSQDFLPSSWHVYAASWVEKLTFFGTFGIFLSLFLLFMRYLPVIAMFEVKIAKPEADPHHQVEGKEAHH